jgi:hypothetical protein
MVKFLKIDEGTLRGVVNLGFNKDHVCESLYKRLQNEVRARNVFLSFISMILQLMLGEFSRLLWHIIYCWTIGSMQLMATLEQIIKNQRLVHISFPPICQRNKKSSASCFMDHY